MHLSFVIAPLCDRPDRSGRPHRTTNPVIQIILPARAYSLTNTNVSHTFNRTVAIKKATINQDSRPRAVSLQNIQLEVENLCLRSHIYKMRATIQLHIRKEV